MPTNPGKMRDVLTKDGWRDDEKKDFWKHPKRLGHIKITPEGWVHEVEKFLALTGWAEKKGLNETDLQEHLKSLESLGKDNAGFKG